MGDNLNLKIPVVSFQSKFYQSVSIVFVAGQCFIKAERYQMNKYCRYCDWRNWPEIDSAYNGSLK